MNRLKLRTNNLNEDGIDFERIWTLIDMYNFKIYHPNEEYTCLICHKLLKNACQNICGCKYCFECVSISLLNGTQVCPGTSEMCTQQEFNRKNLTISNKINKKITELFVNCPVQGCLYQSELFLMDLHIKSHNSDNYKSQFNGNIICSVNLIEKNLNKLENETGKFNDLINNVKNKITSLATEHRVTYSNTIVNINNENSIPISDISLCNQKLLQELENEIKNLKENIVTKSKETSDRISDMISKSNKIMKKNEELEEKLIEVRLHIESEKENKFRRKVDRLDQTKSANSSLINTTRIFNNNRIVTVDKTSSVSPRHKLNEDFKSKSMADSFVGLTITSNMKNRTIELKQYNHKQTSPLAVERHNRTPLRARQLTENVELHAPFQWRIDNFFNKVQSAIKGNIITISSDEFYSHIYGYHLALELYPNGCDAGRNKYLSVFFYLSRGSHDEELEWPMKRCVTISLMNQKFNRIHLSKTFSFGNCKYSDSKGFCRPLNKRNHAVGESCFILLNSVFNNENILQNNSLVFTCSVD